MVEWPPFFFFTAQRGWSKGEEISLSTWLYVPPGAIVKNNQDIPAVPPGA